MQKAINTVIDLFPKEQLEPWEIEWRKCKPLLVKAMKYQDTYTIDDIEDKIRNGIAWLWPAEHSAIVTEYVICGKKKIIHILLASGEYEEIEKIYHCIETHAKEMGVNKITLIGRKGWLRKIKHLGFKPEYLVSKDL